MADHETLLIVGGGIEAVPGIELAQRMGIHVLVTDYDAGVDGHEPVTREGALCGQVTSAAFGYRVGRPVALGMLQAPREGERVELDIGGQRFAGSVTLEAVFDPRGARLRG